MKLTHFFIITGLIAIITACSAPKSNTTIAGKPFEVSPEGLDRTAWRTEEKLPNSEIQRGLIVFESKNNSLMGFATSNADGGIEELIADIILQKLIDPRPNYIITNFTDNKAWVAQKGENGATGDSYFQFENSQKGAWVIFNEYDNPYVTVNLQRIAYPNLSSKTPDWTINSLNGQKWICKSRYDEGNNIYIMYINILWSLKNKMMN